MLGEVGAARPAPPEDGDRATVVICTHYRPVPLSRTLDGLAGQVDPGLPWDVVVVDNAAGPGSEAVVQRHARSFPVALRYIRERREGSAHARNRGLAEVTGTITVVADDDIVPCPVWLRDLLDPIRSGRCDGAGGRVVLDESVPRPWWFDEEGIGGYLTRHQPAAVERPLQPSEYVVTANCAFRTEVLRRCGAFDQALGPRGRTQLVNDDILLVHRFQQAGGRIHHVPDAVVVHELPPERLRPGYLLRRAYNQGRSDWILRSLTGPPRRFGGLGDPVRWVRAAAPRRRAEGLWRPPVAFHAGCDALRAAGQAREAVAAAIRARRPARTR